MGSLFSKDKKQKNDERRSVGSAPSRLEGLDGTTPPDVPEVRKRALTPDTATRTKATHQVALFAAAESPSPASTTSPTEEKVWALYNVSSSCSVLERVAHVSDCKVCPACSCKHWANAGLRAWEVLADQCCPSSHFAEAHRTKHGGRSAPD